MSTKTALTKVEIPLFPLRTVLYPGGPLPLRIFEPRYLDMISRCLKNDAPFGVVLIREGSEIGPATTYEIGTLAKIIDWYQGSDGVLEEKSCETLLARSLAAYRRLSTTRYKCKPRPHRSLHSCSPACHYV